MFTKPPGSTAPFEDYDVFVAPTAVVAAQKPALRAFLAAYHGKGVPYLHAPATQADAVAEITRYVNAEQKTPTDAAAMRANLAAEELGADCGEGAALLARALDDYERNR